MQRDLVENRQWIVEADYQEGLVLAQLAMYLGYVRGRKLGATLVGIAFIWPSFFMVVILGWLYQREVRVLKWRARKVGGRRMAW